MPDNYGELRVEAIYCSRCTRPLAPASQVTIFPSPPPHRQTINLRYFGFRRSIERRYTLQSQPQAFPEYSCVHAHRGFCTCTRFSRDQVRDLVAENADLKLDVRRARAEILVVTAERRGLEERFLLRTPSPEPTPPAVESGSIAAGSSVASLESGGTEKPRGRFTPTSENPAGTSGACDDGIHRMQGPGVVCSGGGSSAPSLNEPELAVLDRPLPAGGSDLSGLSGRIASGEGKGQTDRSSKSSCSELIAEGANSSGDGDRSKTTTVGSGARVDASEGGDGQDAETCFFPDRTVGGGDAALTPGEATCGTDDHKCERQEELHACTLGTLAELKDGVGGGDESATALSTVQAASGSAEDDPLDLETARVNETTHLDLETVRVNESTADNHLDHETVRLKESDRVAFSRSVRPTPRACSVSVKIVGGACIDCWDTMAETTHPANMPGALLLAGGVGEEETNSSSSPMDVSNSGNQVVERDTNSASDDGDWSISTSICGDKSGLWPSSSFILAQSQR